MGELFDNFPHRCTIRRAVRSTDDIGGRVNTYVTERTGIECWVQQASAGEVREYDKRGITVTKKVYFMEDFNLTERHEVIVTSKMVDRDMVPVPVEEQVPYYVSSEPKPDVSAGMGILYRVMVREFEERGVS